jgi:hypothetical protein
MEGQHAQTLAEAAIIPALSGFLLCLGVILFNAWHPVPRPGPWTPLTPGRRRRLIRDSVRLVAWGCLAFFGVVLVFSVILQHETNAWSALWSAPFLLAITLPVWILLTRIADRRARHRLPSSESGSIAG